MIKHRPTFENLDVPQGTLLIEYLGQAGYRIKGEAGTILIDPYLSNFVVESGIGDAENFSRAFPPPEKAQELHGIDFVFITHDHADHCDPLTLMPLVEENPGLKIICPPSAARTLQGAGIPSSFFTTPAEGKWEQDGSVAYTAIPSAHYALEIDPETRSNLYLGYVLKINGVTIYHAGDTILYPGMLEILKEASSEYDIVCLPVNGRDAKREAMGIIGNLEPDEALELTLELKASVMLPMHNDLFASNHLSQGVLSELAEEKEPRQRIHWLQPGELFWYVK
ncbi:MBL fold metallo-hydrolase [bacterium]|nr:MBL fold metallo-hydrolase [bacterium]